MTRTDTVDHARALEVLDSPQVINLIMDSGHGVKVISALVRLYAAAVEFRSADRAFFGKQGPRGTVKRLEAAGVALDEALANVEKAVNREN